MKHVYPKCVLAALALLGTIAHAQTTASLSGVVTDASAASVPEAVVTLTGSGVAQQRKTDVEGKYSFTGIVPGNYTVRVTRPGFSVFEMLEYPVAGATKLDVQMTVTLEAQKIDIKEDNGGVAVDPNQSVGALVIKGEQLEALSDDPDQLEQDLQALAGPAAGPNGGQIFIDGFSGGKLPPKASIREVRINSNPFSAEYDRLGFGRIEIFTKPGSDRFRGQFSTMFSDNLFNARNPFVSTRPEFQSRMFSGNVGGRLTKKSSFGLDIENRGVDENSVINATILDTNLMPVSLRDSILTPQRRLSIVPRIDYAINDKNTLVVRYNFSRSTQENQGIGNFSLADRAYNTRDLDHTLQITETAVLSPRAINETRLQFMRGTTNIFGDNAVPTINVLDAFTGGGAQVGLASNRSTRWELHNNTTVTAGAHTVKFGARVRTGSLTDLSPNNFGGTFTFAGANGPELDALNQPIAGTSVRLSSLEQYRRTQLFLAQGMTIAQIRALGGGATQFTIAGGNPLASVSQTDVGLFLLDDWRLKPNFTLSYGVRYENQTNISDSMNFSPRVSFAWGVDGGAGKTTKTVLRGGFGIFYDRVGENLTLQALRFNGVNQEQYIVPNPSFYPVIPSLTELGVNRQTLTVRQLDSDIRAPYIAQGAIGIDRQLPKNTNVSVNYTFSRGVRMLRTVNANAPLADGTRPYGAETGNLFLYESTGLMRQNQLTTNLNTRFSPRISLFGFYSLSYARGDTDGAGSFPAVTNDYRADWGPTMFDVRHRVFLGGSISAPMKVSLSPFITANSGAPFNITTGRDTNGDTVFNDRPAFATSGSGVSTPWGTFNLTPTASDLLIPRNFGRGPSQFTVNMRLSRTWGFGERASSTQDPMGPTGGMDRGGDRGSRGPGGGGPGGGRPMMGGGGRGPGGPGGMFGGSDSGKRFNLTLSVSARNLLNNVNLSTPVGNLSSPSFGQSLSLAGGFGPMGSSAASNRRLDFQLRLTF